MANRRTSCMDCVSIWEFYEGYRIGWRTWHVSISFLDVFRETSAGKSYTALIDTRQFRKRSWVVRSHLPNLAVISLLCPGNLRSQCHYGRECIDAYSPYNNKALQACLWHAAHLHFLGKYWKQMQGMAYCALDENVRLWMSAIYPLRE